MYLNALVIGGSQNVGYLTASRLLDDGYTVTFLMRRPAAFDNDEKMQKYITGGKARIVQGDALVKDDVRRAWDATAPADQNVDLVLFTMGFSGSPGFDLFNGGLVVKPEDIRTRAVQTLVTALPPSSNTKFIFLSAAGALPSVRVSAPFPIRLVFRWILAIIQRDHCGFEEVISRAFGLPWKESDSQECHRALVEATPQGKFPAANVVVVRPQILTNGPSTEKEDGSVGYRFKKASHGSLGAWTISREDLAHFMAEVIPTEWQEFAGDRVEIAY